MATIFVTNKEGGEWYELEIHSILLPDGPQREFRRWDEVNGWELEEFRKKYPLDIPTNAKKIEW